MCMVCCKFCLVVSCNQLLWAYLCSWCWVRSGHALGVQDHSLGPVEGAPPPPPPPNCLTQTKTGVNMGVDYIHAEYQGAGKKLATYVRGPQHQGHH